MFGAFRASPVRSGGLLWKDPWRLSGPRKQRVRERLRNVDEVIAAVQKSGVECGALQRALALPTEGEMLPKDKYTTFSPTSRDLRKSIHKIPKWSRITSRTNPRGF